MRVWAFAGCALALLTGAARAQDLHFDGLLDVRAFHPSDQRSDLNGGLGKTERGSGRQPSAAGVAMDALVLRGVAEIAPDFRFIGEVRADPRQRTAIDLLDAYAVWRPVSITRWRWSVKGGAFFPPISLENEGIGWTSDWTLTPSAINSWVGDELRTIGTEGTLEWRGDVDHIEVKASIYGWNQPAGAAIENRGWAFTGMPLGLFDDLHLTHTQAQSLRPGGHAYTDNFKQLDGTPGWYAAVSWDRPDFGKVRLMRYDNMADPQRHDSNDFAWRTKFWSLGYSTEIGELVVLAQAMIGSTVIQPRPIFISTTDFWAAYVLVGWEHQNWRYALRFDKFGTNETQPAVVPANSEHGLALTAAITWSPVKWAHVTGELLEVDSWRTQRLNFGKSPRVVETQAQLALRLYF
jgi:hypothetical protein